MSRKKISIAITIVGVLAVIVIVGKWYGKNQTKKHSPAAVASYTKNDLNIKINYCQPYKKGRLVFGPKSEKPLEAFGEYWRTGANEATTIESETDIKFGDQTLSAGKYSLYTFPGESSWVIGINSEHGQWGYAEPDYGNDVFRTEVPVEKLSDVVEQFEMDFVESGDGLSLILQWDQTKVSIPISAI